jgi:ABC-2 type transport system permease protein
MRRFLALLGREIRGYFYAPIAYVVLVFFLVLTGFFFYAPVSLLNGGPAGFTIVAAFFNNYFFWFGYVLVFPLITMRTFSEEFKLGTIETLMTAPVTDFQVVLSKFLGALFFYVVLWLPSLLYFAVFRWIARESAANAAGAYWGSYLLLLLMGMFYISVGCLASAMTRNQIIAAVISFCAITMLFFSGLLSRFILTFSPALQDVIGYFSAVEHMVGFSKGIIDTRPIVFYLTMTVLMLTVTFQVFQLRKWRA